MDMSNYDLPLRTYNHLINWEEITRFVLECETDPKIPKFSSFIDLYDYGKSTTSPEFLLMKKAGFECGSVERWENGNIHCIDGPAVLSPKRVEFNIKGAWYSTPERPASIYVNGGFEFLAIEHFEDDFIQPIYYDDGVGEYGWRIGGRMVEQSEMFEWADENGVNAVYPDEHDKLLMKMKWS